MQPAADRIDKMIDLKKDLAVVAPAAAPLPVPTWETVKAPKESSRKRTKMRKGKRKTEPAKETETGNTPTTKQGPMVTVRCAIAKKG